ncbi:TPA: oligosaccharide flippase family protein [Aeromonas veronii]
MFSFLKSSRMASAGFIQIVTFIIAGLCQLIVTLLLAKYYDKDSLGIISIISIINLFGFSLAEAGVCNYVIYKGAIEKRCFFTIQWAILFLSSLMSLCSLLIYAFEYSEVICNSVAAASLCFPLLSLGVVQYSKLICDYRFKDILYIEVFFRVSLVAFVYFFLFYDVFHNAIYGYVCSLILSYIVRLLVIHVRTKDYTFVSYKSDFDRSVFSSFMSFYMSQIGSNAINAVGNKLDEVIILSSLGLSNLGQYFIVKQFVMQIFSALYQVKRRLLMPLWSNKGTFNVDKVLYLSFLIVCLTTLTLYVTSNLVSVDFIAASLNSNLIMVFGVISMIALRYMSGNLQCAYFQVKGKPYVELYWNVIQTSFISFFIALAVMFFNISTVEQFVKVICFLYFLVSIVGYIYFSWHGIKMKFVFCFLFFAFEFAFVMF